MMGSPQIRPMPPSPLGPSCLDRSRIRWIRLHDPEHRYRQSGGGTATTKAATAGTEASGTHLVALGSECATNAAHHVFVHNGVTEVPSIPPWSAI